MSNAKTFKKGEVLFKESDKVQNVLLVQSGAVSLGLSRNKKNVDLFQIGSSQVLAEYALFGSSTHPYTATATQETKVVEVPVELFKQQIEGSQPMAKALIKSLGERLKATTNDVKSSRLEKDPSPCPEDQVAKVFGSIFHSTRHKGQKLDDKNPDLISIDWTMLKQYSQRIFGESLKRLEQAVTLLVKIKMATFEMGKLPEDPEGPDHIMKVHFSDLPSVEAFFEFYQYYYFKGSKGDILKPDEGSMNMVHHLLLAASEEKVDRFGAVAMDFSKTIEKFKADYGLILNNETFTRLEQKGLFAKRQPKQDGNVVLSFEVKEFQTTLKIWKILKEIEKWNEKGFVDLNEEDAKAKKKTDGPTCPTCGCGVQAQAKFCSECGGKLGVAA